MALSGCVTFSEARWQDYAGDGRCAEQQTFEDDQQSAMPIFFVTTRLPDCRSQPYQLTIQRGDRIRYGRVGAKGTSKKPTEPVFAFQARELWLDSVAAAARKADGKVVVYMHGYNNGFHHVAMQTEQIRHHSGFGGPVISYNWPSHASGARYAVDQVNQIWDLPYFISELVTLSARPEISEIILVAHSMGTRSGLAALAGMDSKHPAAAAKLKNIILVSGDADRQIFEREARDHLLTQDKVAAGRRITLFVSDEDNAVRASRFLHGYDRLGYTGCVDPLATPPCYARPERDGRPIDGLRIVDTSAVSQDFAGHKDFIDSPIGRQFFCEVLLTDMRAAPTVYSITVATPNNAPAACADSDMVEL
ncbi:alpha/beta hydrolase [Alterisphingorhabdus coralli]|uniref:Alpha/beta fold hydrolase n=1 Tax=Alterisphingorhabdus coralli TaxID=3071408 RepID=A0AA97F6W8_9SPHN|nr:alpha/beta hydrolase [Parasphingorhabdus sp. SCSIO 66989]WOE74556.1 alpha/beta fold hydrolase [Parasphingorhabdus sp. SCSIO 66989]